MQWNWQKNLLRLFLSETFHEDFSSSFLKTLAYVLLVERDDFSLLKPDAIDHIILWSLLYGLPVIGKFTETERLVIPKGWGTREWKWLLIARNVCLGWWKVRNWREGVAAHYFECTKCCWIIHMFSNKLCLFHLN